MIRKLILSPFLLAASLGCWAQSLPPSQYATLKACINANATWAALPNTSDNALTIATGLNAAASPTFYVYRTNVATAEIGNAFNGTEVAGLSSLNMQRLQLNENYSNGTVDFSRSDRRQLFTDVFSGAGGANTRAALAVVWSRAATLGEKCLATGTGTQASPATMSFEGQLTYADVQAARQ